MKNKKVLIFVVFFSFVINSFAIDHKGITFNKLIENGFTLIEKGNSTPILIDKNEDIGIMIATKNLQKDFLKVSGNTPLITHEIKCKKSIIIGTLESSYIKDIVKSKKLDLNDLKNKNERYVLTTLSHPIKGVDEALVIVGSDKRGTIYGIYELSEQIGVSPWYDWADVPIKKQKNLSIKKGYYTIDEPAVKYRGIFLNDEAPCLTGWVKHTYGTDYGDHRFYSRICELILRLRGNFLWPAMWSWAFYADDPLNSKMADDMGIVIGTSHHEPMARNHQEWARNRKEYGKWNYSTNQKVIDQFFKEGIERMQHTEDIVTIGMRGDGDEAMSEEADVKLLERIVKNQRKIIEKVTKKSVHKTPQIWALYKEVLQYYEKGMRVPDDVIMLICDDNWGNVRRLPNKEEQKHPGGWGLYYHVDYVGAPRNSKWLNVTPIQNIWEQLQLTYDYGVEELWVLNVGDLKPMEYPITLFLDMAWNPKSFTVDNLLNHTWGFCAQQFGEEQADEAMRILNLYSKYNGRITAEMLDATTYNVETGEWKKVSDEYLKLEAEALRQYMTLRPEYKDAYKQLILFPVQAMANIYEMYYAQAMNHKLYAENNPQANFWADKVENTFKRDSILSYDYNNIMSGGKWKNMMIQKHISYTTWNDDFPADVVPTIYRMGNVENQRGNYVFTGKDGYVAMEAEHYFGKKNGAKAQWTVIPYMGRTLSGITLMPYTEDTKGALISYKMNIPKEIQEVTVHIIVKSTLAFHDKKGHEYTVGFDGGEQKNINFNWNLNDDPENVYTIFYPTVASRVVENKVKFSLPQSQDNIHTLFLKPLDPGIVFEKIVVDYGGYQESFLFMDESPNQRVLE